LDVQHTATIFLENSVNLKRADKKQISGLGLPPIENHYTKIINLSNNVENLKKAVLEEKQK